MPTETAATSGDAGSPNPSGASPADRRRVWCRTARIAALVTGLAAIVFLWLDDRFGWLSYQPGGTAFFSYVRPVAYALMVIGGLLALRWEVVGAVVGAFAAGAIGAFAVNQLVGWHSTLVIALLAVPAALWLVADAVDWTRRHIAIGLGVALIAAAGGAATGEAVYEASFGPTHPESDVVALPESPVAWIWSGGVTPTSAEVRARTTSDDAERLRLAIVAGDASQPDWDAARFVPVTSNDEATGGEVIAGFAVDDLAPDTTYHYAVEVDGTLDTIQVGRFTTFPDGPASFRFTVGACARVGSNGSVFDAIVREQPLFHLIAGDFHYGDIPDDERDRYDDVIGLTLRQPAQAALYRSTPIAYVWDDHDYGVNDSDSFSASRAAAMAAYRANVPSYELAGALSPVYQRFDVGRVRFLLTDARSGREGGVTLLGADQLAWLLDELVLAAEEQALVVWLNPVPWVADEEEGADHWGGFPEERRIIADTIAEHDIDNLLMISGDAHMVAIDDGTNTDFSSDGTSGFPLLHAAALDRPGTVKGGPYSVGAIGGSGQYGVVDVRDDGDVIEVDLRAKRYDGTVLLQYRFDVEA